MKLCKHCVYYEPAHGSGDWCFGSQCGLAYKKEFMEKVGVYKFDRLNPEDGRRIYKGQDAGYRIPSHGSAYENDFKFNEKSNCKHYANYATLMQNWKKNTELWKRILGIGKPRTGRYAPAPN